MKEWDLKARERATFDLQVEGGMIWFVRPRSFQMAVEIKLGLDI